MSKKSSNNFQKKVDLKGLLLEMKVQNVDTFLEKYPSIKVPSDLITKIEEFQLRNFSDCLSVYDQDMIHHFVQYAFPNIISFDHITINNVTLWQGRFDRMMDGVQSHIWIQTFSHLSVDPRDVERLRDTHKIKNFEGLMIRYDDEMIKSMINNSISKKGQCLCNALVEYGKEKMMMDENFDGHYPKLFHHFKISEFISWNLENHSLIFTIPVLPSQVRLNGETPISGVTLSMAAKTETELTLSSSCVKERSLATQLENTTASTLDSDPETFFSASSQQMPKLMNISDELPNSAVNPVNLFDDQDEEEERLGDRKQPALKKTKKNMTKK